MIPYVEIEILTEILQLMDRSADVTPEALAERAKCWQCKVSPGMAPYIIAQLLSDILQELRE